MIRDNKGPRSMEPWRQPLIGGLRASAVGEWDTALSCFEQALLEGPKVPEVRFAYGRELLRRGDDRGLAHLEYAHERAPDLSSATAELARALARRGDLDRARELLAQADAADPVMLVTSAEIEVEAGQFEHAAAAAESALEHSDSEAICRAASAALARCHQHAGLEAANAGDYESAIFLFKRARDCDGAWTPPLVNMAAAFSRLGKHHRALELLEEANDESGADPTTALNIGTELIHLGRWERARDILERATRDLASSEPGESLLLALAHQALARAHRALGDDSRAVRSLEFASHLVGAGAEIWADLARAHLRCGELGKARRAARIAMELDPDDDDVRGAWEELAKIRPRRDPPHQD